MNLCRFTPKKTCERQYGDCENCRVPNSFGFYQVVKGSKLVWEQRFILEKRREKRLRTIDAEIEKLNKERQAVLELPGK